MRTKLVKRYYCDHCNRGSLTKKSMEAHEARCFRNPNRKCELCVEVCGGTAQEMKAALENGGLEALRAKAEGCPRCIMAAILQSTEGKDLNEAWIDFDYKKEKEEWDKEQWALRWEGVGF